jgi:hypothetical protein
MIKISEKGHDMRRIGFAFVLACATATAFAQRVADAGPEPTWSLPQPSEYGAHLQALCRPEISSVTFIAAWRSRGFSKEQAAAKLPSDIPQGFRMSAAIIENLDDLYAYPKIETLTYFIFRSQSCIREKAEGKPIVFFASISEKAMKCQETIGIKSQQALAKCIQQALP